MAVLDTKTYRRLEWHLFNYFDMRRTVREYKDRRHAITDSSRIQVTGGGGGVSRRSDPTVSKTIDLLELAAEYQAAAPWVQVIEQVIDKYEGSPKGQLLELKYFSDMGEEYICSRLAIERATYFNWRNEIVIYTALVAAQSDLIQIC